MTSLTYGNCRNATTTSQQVSPTCSTTSIYNYVLQNYPHSVFLVFETNSGHDIFETKVRVKLL